MKLEKGKLEQALAAKGRAELAAALTPRTANLSLSDIQHLAKRLQSFDEPFQSVRLAIVHTFTSDLLQPYLEFEALLQGLKADVYHAPYGVTIQEARPSSGLAAHHPDVTYLLLRWEDLDPSLSRPISALPEEGREALTARVTKSLADQLSSFRKTVGGQIVVTLLPRMYPPGLGSYDSIAAGSETHWRNGVKVKLANVLRNQLPSVYFLDLDAFGGFPGGTVRGSTLSD